MMAEAFAPALALIGAVALSATARNSLVGRREFWKLAGRESRFWKLAWKKSKLWKCAEMKSEFWKCAGRKQKLWKSAGL